MKLSVLLLGPLVLFAIFISGCIQDSVVQKAEPYITEIVFEDINLRTQASSIVAGCPSGDRECHLNKVYRHVVEEYSYYSDPRSREFIQSPSETMNVKGGDCEDLTILLNSLLENLGIKTYLVLDSNHAYSLACGINTDNLWQYIQDSIVTQFSRDLGKDQDFDVVVEQGKLFLVARKQETFILDAWNVFYYGGDGSGFEFPIEYMDIKYDLSSSEPLSIYVVPSRADYELFLEGHSFTHYPSCKKEDILSTIGSCGRLSNYGGIVLKNNNWRDSTVALNLDFYFYYPAYKLLKDQKISYYTIDNLDCVVLDATAGKYGYPGYKANLTGEKIAIDPITKEYIYLS